MMQDSLIPWCFLSTSYLLLFVELSDDKFQLFSHSNIVNNFALPWERVTIDLHLYQTQNSDCFVTFSKCPWTDYQ